MENKTRISRIFLKILWDIFSVTIPALLIALFVNVYVVEAVEIEMGSSMEPNMYVGYRVMTEKISYRFRDPQRGEVVVADVPDMEAGLIKRVVALPGEVFAVREGHTYINGERLDEPWVTHIGGRDYSTSVVPEGHIFIVGDNRVASRDSLVIVPIPLEDVTRRAWLIYWPLNEFEILP
ncbi:MAG: signal peptidase I [Anaerolineales bacterium]|nr:signal peptidase I [Chloroflexota bacterium]MBL6981217.1 signal peptidase I [Anaerolineales bacterium]